MPCSRAMRRIHLSDFTLMVSPLLASRILHPASWVASTRVTVPGCWMPAAGCLLQTFQVLEFTIKFLFDHPLRDRDERRQDRRARPIRIAHFEFDARAEPLQRGAPVRPLQRRAPQRPVPQLLQFPAQGGQEGLAVLEAPFSIEGPHILLA